MRIERIFIIVLAIGLAACGRQDARPADGPTWLDQGWDESRRQAFHFTPFGSSLLPYTWLLHLEQADSTTRLLADDSARSFGLIPAAQSPKNPDALPIGVARSGNAAGFTCAACHTGEVVVGDARLVIEGGQSHFDFQAFENAVVAALQALLDDDAKRERFANAIGEDTGAALREAITTQLADLTNRQRVNRTSSEYGPGRLDAFGQIFNTIAVTALNIPENRMEPDAPVSYPVLWDAPHLDLVQWNGSAPNAAIGPLIQNVTTAIAVYGHVDLAGHSGLGGYPSSVDVKNLGQLQNWLYSLRSPIWPAHLLGALDTALVDSGEAVYAQHCASCHALVDRDDPNRKIRVTNVATDEIGTDRENVDNYLNDQVDPGFLTGRKVAILAGDVITNPSPAIDLVAHAAIGATLHHPLATAQTAIADYHKVYDATIEKYPNHYKARPLDGIWTAAPYLHNGSVPTLHDLLLPPAQRPTRFVIGNGEFDAVKVGLAAPAAGGFAFDTTRKGNGNQGHEYGTNLPADDRRALLEYLKSL